MKITSKVNEILANYSSDNLGTKSNLARILMHGKLAGTGKMIILPVDQGFEHGPARSFAMNPLGYDPIYHHELAIEAGLSAYAAPLGMLEASIGKYFQQIPTILKINSSNSLFSGIPDQAITASVEDAVRLGCAAIGFTIYPGSENSLIMMEQLAQIANEAKACGLAVVVWSYPRGGNLTKQGETAIDTIAYGAHMAALLGAHIIKVKLPDAHIEQAEAKKAYINNKVDISDLKSRIAHIKDCCFAGRRLVVFSGGAAKSNEEIFADAKAISAGGGNGSIIGRNSFQRPTHEALDLLDKLINIYLGKF